MSTETLSMGERIGRWFGNPTQRRCGRFTRAGSWP
jgi:hypothetical protein